MEYYDIIVIGAGISGLTCAALLAKKGLNVCVVEAHTKPGGSCGIFKRNGVVFEQGAAMLYGFGKLGFNPHRYVCNVLEQPINVVKHEHLYAINFGTERIIFYEEMEKFLQELIRVFPEEEKGIRKFYKDMTKLYLNVIAETPIFVSPDVLKKEQGREQFLRHPMSYLRFLSYMNLSMKTLLRRYFKGEEILKFFDKMTSTYCYATVEEAPAVLGAVMFIDNHYGGSYYPAGSTLQFIGILEKSIEEHGGVMRYGSKVTEVVIKKQACQGVRLESGEYIRGQQVIYSGNIWSLYEELVKNKVSPKVKKSAISLKPTYPSIVFYAVVKKEVIPEGTLPIEMFITDKDRIDENEITVYILSMDDQTLCPADCHVIVAIGPSFRKWPEGHTAWYGSDLYEKQKVEEEARVIHVLERRFPSFEQGIVYKELATPSSLTHYTLKYHGAVAGPKQMLGQHMLKRQHTKTVVNRLYCCGEATVMGTGTPAVTVSGIAAANLVLRERGMKEYDREDCHDEYINIVTPPFTKKQQVISEDIEVNEIAKMASCCQFCEKPNCEEACKIHMPIQSINRRAAVGNVAGCKKMIEVEQCKACIQCETHECEMSCIRRNSEEKVFIHQIIKRLNH